MSCMDHHFSTPQTQNMEERFRRTPSFNNPYFDLKKTLPKLNPENRQSLIINKIKRQSSQSSALSQKPKVAESLILEKGNKYYASSSQLQDAKRLFSRQVVRSNESSKDQSAFNSISKQQQSLLRPNTNPSIISHIETTKPDLIEVDKYILPQKNSLKYILKNIKQQYSSLNSQFNSYSKAEILQKLKPSHPTNFFNSPSQHTHAMSQDTVIQKLTDRTIIERDRIQSSVRLSCTLVQVEKTKNRALIKLQGNIIKKLFPQ